MAQHYVDMFVDAQKRAAYKIDGSLIADAVNAVNDFRAKVGLEPVSDLPKGDPGDVTHCIFAKAFNFSCTVHPYGHIDADGEGRFGGYIQFKKDDGDKAEALATILGTDVQFDSYYYTVDIPEYIAKIARAFDNGYLKQYEDK